MAVSSIGIFFFSFMLTYCFLEIWIAQENHNLFVRELIMFGLCVLLFLG